MQEVVEKRAIETFDVVCPECKGTGLYIGMAERDGCAVICNSCKGSGKQTIQFEMFSKRKPIEGVKRVFQNSFGMVHTAEDIERIKFSEGGCTYDEWIKGKEPLPVKELYCPLVWAGQGFDDKYNGLTFFENNCNKCLQIGQKIGECSNIPNKQECWRLFDEEVAKDY